MNCRHCDTDLCNLFIDLGAQPPSNAYLSDEMLNQCEIYLPLKLYVCDKCFLVQTQDFTVRETFFNSEYAYFSSTSTSWLLHAKEFSISMIDRFSLNEESFVVEIASNDGYLLQNFVENNVPCLGIEPTESTAKVARERGINTLEDFFGYDLSKKLISNYGKVDFLVGNNVYAHVPDINDFTKGIECILNDNGVVSLEFPHFYSLIKHNQFDTIYHEHYSYLSLNSVMQIFKKSGLRVFDVEKISTHGGSLRVLGCKDLAKYEASETILEILKSEERLGLMDMNTYNNFYEKVSGIKLRFLQFLVEAKTNNKLVVGYGAAAKGNTLLNYSGVKKDLISCVFDAAKSKQGKFLPGSQIPILNPIQIKEYDPDYVVIFPWNIKDEIVNDLSKVLSKKTKFVTVVPSLEIFPHI
jgi:hypothetical protein